MDSRGQSYEAFIRWHVKSYRTDDGQLYQQSQMTAAKVWKIINGQKATIMQKICSIHVVCAYQGVTERKKVDFLG